MEAAMSKINKINLFIFVVKMIVLKNLFLKKSLQEKELMDFQKWSQPPMSHLLIIFIAFILSFMFVEKN